MKRLFIGTALAVTLMTAASANAHHSAAGIDRTKSVTVEGTVKHFKWGNPHSWLEIEVPNAKGGVDLWNFEMNPPAYLVRSGWKATSVKSGDKVKVTARPFISGDPGGIFVSATLANGTVLGSGQAPSNVNAPQPPATRPAQPPR